MAGEWIKFESSLPEKPETLAITAAMGWTDPDLTVGKLMRLFRWFDQQTTDGNANAVTTALLDRVLGVSGFCDALSKVGWLVVAESGLTLNNFDKHNGQSAKSRSETAKRVAKHRTGKAAVAEPTAEKACIPRPIRSAVLIRDSHTCVYCSRKEGEYGPMETKSDGVMHLDHVIPAARNGSDDVTNLATACRPCNMFKGDRTPDECGFAWPEVDGKRLGNTKPVTSALPREEKRREEIEEIRPPSTSQFFPEPTPGGRICKAMRQQGLADGNPSNPTLMALIAAGATDDEFIAAAKKAVAEQKGFAYALGIVTGERKRAAALAQQIHHGDLPAAATRPTFAQQAADIARTTVPAPTGRDPALMRIEADAAKAKPITPEIRRALAEAAGRITQ